MKFNRNNRGMAFVSVLIAVLFIGLLATSLCFMAYNNYITKSTRWSSENNFYYDEFALNELSTIIRDRGEVGKVDAKAYYDAQPTEYKESNPEPDETTEFFKALATAVGATGDDGDPTKTFSGTWNPDNMNALITTYGISESSNIDVEVSVPNDAGGTRNSPVYERKGQEVFIKNVRIKVTDNNTSYTTTITTDIHMPTKPAGYRMPVNEFSLMADGPLYWTSGGIMHIGGNLFCINDAKSANHTQSVSPTDADDKPDLTDLDSETGSVGKFAAIFNNGSQITLGGKNSLFVGDVYVANGSILNLYNSVTITGRLIVDDGSHVFCNGSDVKIGCVTDASAANVEGTYSIDTDMATRASKVFNGGTDPSSYPDYNNGLANAIPDDVYFMTDVVKGTNTVSSYNTIAYKKTGAYESSLNALSFALNENDVTDTTIRYGSTAQVYFRNASTTLSGDSDNRLIFMAGADQDLRYSFKNSTIIATSGDATHSLDASTAPYMTKMNDADYAACLNTIITNTDAGKLSPKVNDGGYLSSDHIDDYVGAVNTAGSVCLKIEEFDNIVKNGSTTQYYIEPMASLSKDGTVRYYVYDMTNNMQLIPWKYFIRSDADSLIGTAFGTIRDGGGGDSKYHIVYENWVKE